MSTDLWAALDIEPLQLSLPGDSGYLLRHYREGDDGPEPVFLGGDRIAYAFRSTDSLAAFCKNGEPHDLADLPGWEDVAAAPEIDVTPDELGVYRLDLVVAQLRSGPDGWDDELLVLAGEIARDLGKYAELPDVLSALAAGTPLDSLDDDLRGGGYLARRRLRRLDTEQLAIGWRTVISRLVGAVEFRD